MDNFELLERASEICEQVYDRLRLAGCVDPRPRDFACAVLGLNLARRINTGHWLPADAMTAAFWYLVPPFDR